MKKGISEDKAELLIREQQLRREVYNTIVSLTENVDEDMLQKSINNLDQSSWMELVEERYLGRICGFPLCNNAVKMKKSQKYRIDLRSKKIFERSADVDKFCSRDCFLRSAAVKAQLEVEPLWIRGNSQSNFPNYCMSVVYTSVLQIQNCVLPFSLSTSNNYLLFCHFLI
ncbi:unnamed protein product [Thelazia callipaeda]|uniref:RNA polymerase II subunit B1 CTD phosphatase RPAP2 homolog n=1 Tax=Thelazia callipaeda TaxID=103827 RepID=A0A0N5D2N2_THECL|nr:unnamed protein product [Thelazia callipaeda]